MSTASKTASISRELEAICGSANVAQGEADLHSRAIDGVAPQVVVRPANAEEVAAVLKFASARELAVVPAGNFSRQQTGLIPARVDIVLEATRMNAIQYYEPGDLTVGVQAGARLSDVLARVEANGQTIPIDPPNAAKATMGGIVATTASGPLRHGYGSVREFCLGVQFATTEGKVAKAGGRVVKNVAGYDVTKLLVGSYGTLAVITSVNLRVFPKPRQTRTFASQFQRFADVLHARDRVVLDSPLTPMALEIVSPTVSTALMPASAQQAWTLLLRAAGSDRVLERYRKDLSSLRGWEIGGTEETALWTAVADFPDTAFAREPGTMIIKLCVPMQRLNGVMQMAEYAAETAGFQLISAGRATTPLSLAFIPAKPKPNYAQVVDIVRKKVNGDGTAIVTHCPTEAKRGLDVWGVSANDATALETVKRALDPKAILNRGRFAL